MNDEHDEYLWTGEGAVSQEIAALERELRPLAWKPRELSLPSASTPIPITPKDQVKPQPQSSANKAQHLRWAPLLAGLAAAAAVFAVFVWLRNPSEEDSGQPDLSTQPSVQPTGRPSSPKLVDPFAGDAEQSFPDPSKVAPKVVDPFASPKQGPRRRVSPDLKDPFASSSSPPPAPEPAPNNERKPHKELQDPFGGDNREPELPRKPAKLYDPFTGKQADPPNYDTPDLKDPFGR